MGQIEDRSIYELGSIIRGFLDYLGNRFREAVRIFQPGPYIYYDRFPHTALLFYLLHLTFINFQVSFRSVITTWVSSLADRFSSSCLHIPRKPQQSR